jgi:hypothetical protein
VIELSSTSKPKDTTFRPRAIDRIKQELENENVIQVVGHTGSGKTYSIKKACEELGYVCITLDRYEDYPKLDFDGNKVVLHLDHPSYWYDGTDKPFKERGLVVIEEDRPRYSVQTIWVDTPPLSFFEARGVKVRNWWKVVVGGQAVSDASYKTLLIQAFNTGVFDNVDKDELYTLWDTGIRNYYGLQLLRFVQLMTVADKFTDFRFLNGLKLVKKINEVDNTFLYRLREMRNEKDESRT